MKTSRERLNFLKTVGDKLLGLSDADLLEKFKDISENPNVAQVLVDGSFFQSREEYVEELGNIYSAQAENTTFNHSVYAQKSQFSISISSTKYGVMLPGSGYIHLSSAILNSSVDDDESSESKSWAA